MINGRIYLLIIQLLQIVTIVINGFGVDAKETLQNEWIELKYDHPVTSLKHHFYWSNGLSVNEKRRHYFIVRKNRHSFLGFVINQSWKSVGKKWKNGFLVFVIFKRPNALDKKGD